MKEAKVIKVEEMKKDPKKLYATDIRMVVGCDLLPSKTSLRSGRSVTMEVTAIGVVAYSLNSGRKILIPFANLTGIELASDE